MITENEALDHLADSGLAAVIKWAAPVAFARTAQDFDEDAGHDQSIVGGHNYVYIRDLLDRSTGNGRYIRGADVTGLGEDFVSRGISAQAFATMPALENGSIVRSDYQQSPGWASGDIRLLIQSYKLGQIDKIRWMRPAKKRVAGQQFLTSVPLFEDEDMGLQSLPGIPDDDEFDGSTLIAAHASNPITGQFELYVGQSKNPAYRGDGCWHWRQPLLRGGQHPLDLRAPASPDMPGNAPTGVVEEISVTVRAERRGKTADGSE
ncbi:hypothetical protein GCM10027413_21540 [Conyzicola nivalis]|uniref:Uncharacterized protein n=1 Tax=Conyzicola nivalis TaxID=1477021 RepID=A0A916WFP1_9MICO|nr:hypothetical protein [Conyzicola nivalis]GGA93490.1 hypothetical protein GCM10010979_05080 [Conyzicola nivalis]